MYSHPPPATVLACPSIPEQFIATATWLKPHNLHRIPADCQDSQGKWLSAELTVIENDYYPSVARRHDTSKHDWMCRVTAHFVGWDDKWNETIDVALQPYRLAPPGTAARCSSAWHPLWWHRAGERVMCWYASLKQPTAGDWLEGRIKKVDGHQAHVTLDSRRTTRWYRLDLDCVIPREEYDNAKQVWQHERTTKQQQREAADHSSKREEEERLRAQRANVASAEILSYRQRMELQAAREKEKLRRRSSASVTPTSPSPSSSSRSMSISPTHTYTDPLPAALQQAEKSRSRSVISTSTSPTPPLFVSPTARSRSAATSVVTSPSFTVVPSVASPFNAAMHVTSTPASITRSHSISSSSTPSRDSRTSSSTSSAYATTTLGLLHSASSTNSSAHISTPTATSTASVTTAAAPFFIGQFVEARDVMDTWMPATITRIDTDNARVHVHFDGWSTQYDEWISYLPPSPPTTPRSHTSPSHSHPYIFPISARLRPLGSTLEPSNEEVLRSEQEKSFRVALSDAGFELIEQEGDGNCLYRCFAYLLYGTADEHRRVRSECMSYIEHECAYYARFISDETITQYITRGRRDNEWGDHVEIDAMKELYDVNVLVITAATGGSGSGGSGGSVTGVVLDVKGEVVDGLDTVRLSYHGQSHYNTLVDATTRVPLLKRSGEAKVKGVWRQRRLERERAESAKSAGVKDELKEGEVVSGVSMKDEVRVKSESMLDAQKILLSPTMRMSN